MLARGLLQFVTLCIGMTLGSLGTRAADSEFTREDIIKIKAVCRSLLGVEDWRPKEIFTHRLMPYIRSKKALAESSQVQCSFHCGGALLLRGDADIWYGFLNQPIGVTHRIDTVAFHVHGKRIFAPGPGLDYYPYPYYDRKGKKR
jgi:hypothetical protein